MTFGFDDRFAMFDITPVENQFILEYLPSAPGDYIKVYLYGLMRCYHPETDMTLDRMSRELNMDPEEIKKAYRYWERQGLVRRISDQGPDWRYVNVKQRNIAGDPAPLDQDYRDFGEALYDVFDNGRRLHGSEIMTCYEWVEDLKLPPEVVIMLLRHMAAVKGKNFSVRSAGTVATQMAQEGILTPEAAEQFLSRDRQLVEGTKKVLKKLGTPGNPSEAQIALYRKWLREWRFTPEAIEAACDQTVAAPNMKYLDGVLSRMREENRSGSVIGEAQISASAALGERLRKLLKILGVGRITEENRELLLRLEEQYDPSVIEIGARECAAGGKNLQDLEKLLASWRKKGLTDQAEVEAYVREFRAQNELLRQLREKWNGTEPRIGETARKMVSHWEKDLGFDRPTILKAAEFAYEAKAPMAYLDKLLTGYAEKGIHTPEAAEEEHRRFPQAQPSAGKATKGVAAQQYHQRTYDDPEETPEEILARLNGGGPDA